MTPDSTNIAAKILPAIDSLAARLQVPAKFIWSILVRQAYVEFWTMLLYFTGTVMVGVFAIWLLKKGWVAADKDEWRNPPVRVMVGATLLTVVGIVVLVQYFDLVSATAGIANPEFFALQKILKAVK